MFKSQAAPAYKQKMGTDLSHPGTVVSFLSDWQWITKSLLLSTILCLKIRPTNPQPPAQKTAHTPAPFTLLRILLSFPDPSFCLAWRFLLYCWPLGIGKWMMTSSLGSSSSVIPDLVLQFLDVPSNLQMQATRCLMLQIELCPPKIITHQYLECDLIWKLGLYRSN